MTHSGTFPTFLAGSQYVGCRPIADIGDQKRELEFRWSLGGGATTIPMLHDLALFEAENVCNRVCLRSLRWNKPSMQENEIAFSNLTCSPKLCQFELESFDGEAGR